MFHSTCCLIITWVTPCILLMRIHSAQPLLNVIIEKKLMMPCHSYLLCISDLVQLSHLPRQCRTTEANPNVSGKDSTYSLTSAGSDGSTSSSSDIEGDFTELEDDRAEDDNLKHTLVSLKVRMLRCCV